MTFQPQLKLKVYYSPQLQLSGGYFARGLATIGQIRRGAPPSETLSTTNPFQNVAQIFAVHGQAFVLRQVARCL